MHMRHSFFFMPPRVFWVLYLFGILTETVIAMRLPLYGQKVFRHFTCKVLDVMKLA